MKIEKTEIWITCNKPLAEASNDASFTDARTVRGFFGNMYRNRSQFHGHNEGRLIYKHPLIQYKVFGGSALVAGLKEGAYLLKAIPKLDYIEIHREKIPIVKQNISTLHVGFGLTGKIARYSFTTPWIGLNKDNYKKYLLIRGNEAETNGLLEKILIGNMLSMSKSIGYVVEKRLQMRVKLKESGIKKIKDGVDLISFKGEFETNFLIPDLWGIGKFSARGYGAVQCVDGGSTK